MPPPVHTNSLNTCSFASNSALGGHQGWLIGCCERSAADAAAMTVTAHCMAHAAALSGREQVDVPGSGVGLWSRQGAKGEARNGLPHGDSDPLRGGHRGPGFG